MYPVGLLRFGDGLWLRCLGLGLHKRDLRFDQFDRLVDKYRGAILDNLRPRIFQLHDRVVNGGLVGPRRRPPPPSFPPPPLPPPHPPPPPTSTIPTIALALHP